MHLDKEGTWLPGSRHGRQHWTTWRPTPRFGKLTDACARSSRAILGSINLMLALALPWLQPCEPRPVRRGPLRPIKPRRAPPLRQIKAWSCQLLKITLLLHRTAGSKTRATPPMGRAKCRLATLLFLAKLRSLFHAGQAPWLPSLRAWPAPARQVLGGTSPAPDVLRIRIQIKRAPRKATARTSNGRQSSLARAKG